MLMFGPVQTKTLSLKKIASALALCAAFSAASPAHAKGKSTSSGLPYYADDMVDLSHARCFDRSQYTSEKLEKALEQIQASEAGPCNDDVCFNPRSVSKEQSLRIRYIWNVMGINVFNGGYAHSRPFATEELNQIIHAMALFPKSLMRQLRGASIIHMTTREAHIPVGIDQYQTTSPRAWTDSDNTIRLHTRFDELSPTKKVLILFHELGHVVASSVKINEVSSFGFNRPTDLDTSQTWYTAAGWEDYETISRPEIAASGYARGKYGSAGEDFAESFLRYRLGPQAFRHYLGRHNEKYYFFRDYVFQGVEYLNEGSCREEAAPVAIPGIN